VQVRCLIVDDNQPSFDAARLLLERDRTRGWLRETHGWFAGRRHGNSTIPAR